MGAWHSLLSTWAVQFSAWNINNNNKLSLEFSRYLFKIVHKFTYIGIYTTFLSTYPLIYLHKHRCRLWVPRSGVPIQTMTVVVVLEDCPKINSFIHSTRTTTKTKKSKSTFYRHSRGNNNRHSSFFPLAPCPWQQDISGRSLMMTKYGLPRIKRRILSSIQQALLSSSCSSSLIHNCTITPPAAGQNRLIHGLSLLLLLLASFCGSTS